MGDIRPRGNAILVAALLYGDEGAYRLCLEELESIWGPMGGGSAPIPFVFSRYYEREMGRGLTRRFVSFEEPRPPDWLRDAKIASNRLEERLAAGGLRTVNIDPGLLEASKLVVASTKDAPFRIYLGAGIYAQPMLRFERGRYRPWPWTYPDYRAEAALTFFDRLREERRGVILPAGGRRRGCT